MSPELSAGGSRGEPAAGWPSGHPAPVPPEHAIAYPNVTDGAELSRLSAEWLELGRLEATSRSAAPTAVHKPYASLPAPDLSKTWN